MLRDEKSKIKLLQCYSVNQSHILTWVRKFNYVNLSSKAYGNGGAELRDGHQEQSKNGNTLYGESEKMKSPVLKISRIENQ